MKKQAHSVQTVGQIIQELTGGKPFVFVIMSFNEDYAVFLRIRSIVESQFGFICLRADDVPLAGHDLLDKLHVLIDRAEFVVGDISRRSPNVFYEVGYAVAKQRPILLLAKTRVKIPTDVKGLELIRYDIGDKRGSDRFDQDLRHQLQTRLTSRISLLQDMLQPGVPHSSVIIANPRYPSERSRIPGQFYDHKTFGDNLGVVGLLAAFGACLGSSADVELVSASFHDTRIEQENLNLYLIGSKKINELSGKLLELVQKNFKTQWSFGAAPGEEERGDYPVVLYENGKPKVGRKKKFSGYGLVHVEDYGLIVRAPHPLPRLRRAGRLVMIVAGAHSLGTGAACLAATRSNLIEKIRGKLVKKEDLADESKSIWALVKGTLDANRMLTEETVEVVRVGVYE